MLLDHIGWDYGMDLDEHYQDLALIEIDVEWRVQFILADWLIERYEFIHEHFF